MRKSATGLVVAAICALLLPTWLQASGQADAKKAGDVTYEPFVLKSDDGEIVGELGHLAVPQNRQKPGSSLIEIAFVRFKSTAANPGAPIVDIAGGPGGPGIPNPKSGPAPKCGAAERLPGAVRSNSSAR